MENNNQENIKTEFETDIKLSPNIVVDDWLCRICLQKITSDKLRYLYEGKSEFSFINPAGHQFEILTFANTIGCNIVGESTGEFTWFPNYNWQICLCNKCNAQLGWYYLGSDNFWGLIKSQLVKAMTIMN